MTEDEKIKINWNLLRIARVANSRQAGTKATVYYIRNLLDHIEELLQTPEHEPETLAGSVLRLTDTCNQLEEENRKLKEELDVTSRSNAYLRERLTLKDQSLRACRTAEKILKQGNTKLAPDLRRADARVEGLRKELALREAGLRQVRNDLELILEYSEP